MKSFFKLHKHARRILVSLCALFLLGVGSFSVSSIVHGYTFTGGNGKGCTGTWCTGPGNVNAGWKLFDLNGTGPGGNNGRGFISTSSTTWKIVQSKCESYGIGLTQAYVFVTQALNATSPYLGISYISGYPGTPGYQDASPATAYTYYLQAVAFDPGTASGTWGKSVTAFCYYNNPPWSVKVNATADRKFAEPGELITWTHTITNAGPSSTNKKITYQYVNSGNLTPGSGGNWTLASGSSSGAVGTQTSTYTVQNSDFGKQVCRSTSATPSTNLGGTIASSPWCVNIGKSPKVDVLGGDLSVGNAFTGGTALNSLIDTSQTVLGSPASVTYGSWDEYAAFAPSTISGYGTGSAFSPTGLTGNAICNYSTLSFTNAGTSTCAANVLAGGTIGKYASSKAIPDVADAFTNGKDLGSSPTITLSSFPTTNTQYIYTATGNVTLTGGSSPVGVGKWFVLNAPNATVTITGNIMYTTDPSTPLHSISDIPQVVIIAGTINIDPSVTQVDAWLIAKGSLNTCDSVGAPTNQLTINLCTNALLVNGPVMAGKLYLNRTAGSGVPPSTGIPAETFNLRPDAYLWGYEQALLAGRLQSVYTTELPPRF